MPKPAPLFIRLLPAVIIILALTARVIPGPRTIDDSYITFRYARNILALNGFVYNPGERVLGTTTPLYAFLLTGVGAVSGGVNAPFPWIALGLNALADAAVCLLLLRLGRKLHAPWAGTGAAMTWAVLPFSVTFAIGGLETSLYVFLLLATASAYVEKRLALTAGLGSLALLTRPDALLLLGLLGLDWLGREIFARRGAASQPLITRQTLAAVLLAITPLLAWIIFSTLYFGSPIPHSITAKTVAYRLPAEAGFVRLLQHYATPFMDDLAFGAYGVMAGLALYPFLFLVGMLRGLRQEPRLWPLAAFPWIYFIIFSVANPLIFRWYMTPPLVSYLLFILIGLEQIVTGVLAAVLKSKPQPAGEAVGQQLAALLPPITGWNLWLGHAATCTAVILVPLALLLNGWTLKPDHGPPGMPVRPAPDMAWHLLELYYRQAAEIVSADAAAQGLENPLLAAGDVGVLGFHTPARILDTVGLNSPVSVGYYPLDERYYVINYAVPPDLIIDQEPDYVVILEVYGRAGLLQDARFWQAYRLLKKIPTDIYGSDGMLIFKKDD